MKISLLNGGLGNQVFQYIFARFGERFCPGAPWYLDDSSFFIDDTHNGYELETVFGIKANLLSNYFEQDVWNEFLRLRKEEELSTPQIFLNMGRPIVVVHEAGDFYFNGAIVTTQANEFHPEVITLPYEDLYYHGYWINKNWFWLYKDQMMEELRFPELEDEKNRKYAEQIQNSLSVGIHIRRGDFVTLGWNLSLEYYENACKKVVESNPEASFFVVSDDIEWCRENEQKLGLNLAGDTTYISGNMNGKNYIDMQLLSMCRGMIMSNSSFCYLAALLNRDLEFVVNPTPREV